MGRIGGLRALDLIAQLLNAHRNVSAPTLILLNHTHTHLIAELLNAQLLVGSGGCLGHAIIELSEHLTQ